MEAEATVVEEVATAVAVRVYLTLLVRIVDMVFI